MKTFVAHHKPPINEYDFLAVRIGFTAQPVYVIGDRQCWIEGTARHSRAKQGRTAYTAMTVRFLDDGSAQRFTLSEFNRLAKTAPLGAA